MKFSLVIHTACRTIGRIVIAFVIFTLPIAIVAQTNTAISRYSAPTIADLPMVFDTATHPILVEVVTDELSFPWGMVWLPNGDLLITEREGRVRLFQDGVLDPDPVDGVPAVHAQRLSGLMDIALHPDYAENQLVYLTYNKPGDEGPAVALARGRFDGTSFNDMRDIFVTDPGTSGGARLLFAPDDSLFMTVGGAFTVGSSAERAQDGSDYAGKVLHLQDDGRPFPTNPFIGRNDVRPEIYSLGHRNQQGLTFNPATGELWAHEHAPQGGDELNIIRSGRNYGWPVVSYSRDYSGPRITERPWQEDMEQPTVFWVPSIAPSGLMFYTGDRFPDWQGNVFVGSMRVGVVAGTGHLERVVLNPDGEEIQREWLLEELKQRIRDVKQGPDGLVYVLTNQAEAALLRISPAQP